MRSTGKTKSTSGRAMVVTLLILLVLGAGGYNYHRNLITEQMGEGARPFKSYADSDLQNLEAAYRVEVDGTKGAYDKMARDRVAKRSGKELLKENIKHFDRVQRKSERKRAVAGVVAENMTRLAEVEAEIAYRRHVTGGLSVHLKRLTTI
jgi:hypothetical protein